MMPTFPDNAIEDIGAVKARGGKVFLREVPPAEAGDCQNCGGTGLLWLEFSGAAPIIRNPRTVLASVNGALVPVQSKTYSCPVCTDRSALIRALFERSGLERDDAGWRVDYIAGMSGKEAALVAARGVLERVPKPEGWYLFYGDYGRGKTGLLKSLVAQCIVAGVQAHYCRAADILDEIRSTYNEGSYETESAVKARYSNIKLLAVDEVDRISGTDWANSTLMSVLDNRYMRRAQCCTLFATNNQPNEMPPGFEYLASRFLDGKRVPIGGEDLRGKKASVA